MAEIARNPYQTTAGQAWLRPSWVVYLDILGFVESIREAARSGTQVEHLKRLRSALSEAKQGLVKAQQETYGISSPAPYLLKVFTDNIVLGFPIHDDGEHEFGNTMFVVGQYQYTLLKHGLFVRGGIAFGDLYMDDDVVYGKGLLDAYESEHKLARDPRIVLGPTAMDQVHTHLGWYGQVWDSPHNEHLLVDSDSQMFVNYLAIPIDGMDPKGDLPAQYLQDIEHHRDVIVSRLNEFSNAPAWWSKYAWVGAYHNLYCTDFLDRSTLCIAPELLTQSARRLHEVYTRAGGYVLRKGRVVAKFKSMYEFERQREPE